MSGDSLEYLEYRLQELAGLVARKATSPEQNAFAKHLAECADAAIMLAKVHDGDCGPGDENALIRKALHPGAILEQTIQDAHDAAKNLKRELEVVCGRVPASMITARTP
jgi:hypothetical protein